MRKVVRNDGTVKGTDWMILEEVSNSAAIDQSKLREPHRIELEENIEPVRLYRKLGWNHAGAIQVIEDGSIHGLHVDLDKRRQAIRLH